MLNIHPGIFKEAASKFFLLFFRFIFLSFINMYELWLWPREEHKFRIYIFEKSIGAWKTIVLYHIFANVANCCQDNFFASYTNKFSKQPVSNFCKSRTGHLFANCRSRLFVFKFCKLLFRTTILQFVIQYNLFFAKCGKRFISNIAFKVWLKAVHGVVWGILSTLWY